MSPDKEASWITVWFTEGAAKCVYSQEQMNSIIDALVAPLLEKIVALTCLDGAVVQVRSSYIQGFYLDTPETRAQRYEWEKLLEKQERQAKDHWD